jgi:3-carboxy-cis,cis-muconate cycloisomerase
MTGASVFGHPWLGGLFGDAEMEAVLAPEVTMGAMLLVEGAWARALGAVGVVSHAVAEGAARRIAHFEPEITALREATVRDGVVTKELVRQIRDQAGETLAPAIHKGLTSQDVIDTSLVLVLRQASGLIDGRLALLAEALAGLVAREGANDLMGRTRMQAAVGISAADRIATWADPLPLHRERLGGIRPRVERLQYGGAAGNRDARAEGEALAAALARELGLGNPPRAWHAMRDGIGEYAAWLSLVTGTLGKMGQDVCLMAQQGIDEIALAGGGGSSAMPHKQNPVAAELLVTLARFNAVQVSGMHQALVHEQERSGTAWALEWMILPQMLMATGVALRTALDLVAKIERVAPVRGNGGANRTSQPPSGTHQA